MDSKEVQFAFEMFRLQLQDALTVVGKMILSETQETVLQQEEVTDNLNTIKQLMHNPFDEIIKVCNKLKSEYEDFRNSPELKEHLDLIKNEIVNNPDVIDEIIEATPEEATQILNKLKNKKDENLQ